MVARPGASTAARGACLGLASPPSWPRWGRIWVPPSPNIPDWETALLYPGTCLIEGTTVSEGRGTRAPFRLIGAPWVDGRALADTLNALGLTGVRFRDTTFIPRDLPGMALNPKWKDQRCAGVYIELTEEARNRPDRLRPVLIGLHLVRALQAQWRLRAPQTPFWRPEAFDRLSGDPGLRTLLEQGETSQRSTDGKRWKPSGGGRRDTGSTRIEDESPAPAPAHAPARHG